MGLRRIFRNFKASGKNPDKVWSDRCIRTVRGYYKSLKKEGVPTDPEIEELLRYFKHNPVCVFPYQYTKKYRPEDIDVFMDEEAGLYYVMHENKRLYMPEGFPE